MGNYANLLKHEQEQLSKSHHSSITGYMIANHGTDWCNSTTCIRLFLDLVSTMTGECTTHPTRFYPIMKWTKR